MVCIPRWHVQCDTPFVSELVFPIGVDIWIDPARRQSGPTIEEPRLQVELVHERTSLATKRLVLFIPVPFHREVERRVEAALDRARRAAEYEVHEHHVLLRLNIHPKHNRQPWMPRRAIILEPLGQIERSDADAIGHANVAAHRVGICARSKVDACLGAPYDGCLGEHLQAAEVAHRALAHRLEPQSVPWVGLEGIDASRGGRPRGVSMVEHEAYEREREREREREMVSGDR